MTPLLGILLASTALGAAPERLTTPPITYVLDYGPQHINSPDYVATIAKTPPTLLHLGKDVPMTHNWGPIQALGGENQAYGKRRPYAPEDFTRRLTPEETQTRIDDLTRLAADLHRAGVRWVTPYICGMTIAGHPDTRAGFWEFYDHWDDYRALGLGPRPAEDPIRWMQLAPEGKLQVFYKFQGPFYPAYEPNLRYAACVNNPHWRGWLAKVVENVARCGFDGVFVDNGASLRCYCPCCKKKWNAWIQQRYRADQRQALFGTAEPELSDGRPADLRWAETRRFWHASLAEHLAAIRTTGQRVLGRPFVVFPNGGEHRPESVLQAFADTDLVMFERSFAPNGTNPGMLLWPVVEDIAIRKYNDNIFENKFVECLRRKVRPIMLTRPGYQLPKNVERLLEMNASAATLGFAETAAFGGGGGFLVRLKPECMAAQKAYRDFIEANTRLFDGLESFAQAAIVVVPEETYFGNARHIGEVRKATAQLLDAHVLFDYLIEDQLRYENLKRYAAVVLPELGRVSDAQAAALRRYVEEGGALVAVGLTPGADEFGRPREQSPLDGLLGKTDEAEGLRLTRRGRGTAAYAKAMPPNGTALADWLQQAAGRTLSIVRQPQTQVAAKVRVNAFRQPGVVRYVVHFVNYNVPLGVAALPPDPPGPLEVVLPLPATPKGWTLRSFDPSGAAAELPAQQDGQGLRFTLSDLKIHKVVEIQGK